MVIYVNNKIIYTNSIIIAILAIIATTSGLFLKGLYKNDTSSITAQMMGQDLITLTIGVPILILSMYLVNRGSFRGRLIWMGTVFYFLYSYVSMSFLASYNQLFLIYVAIFSISLYTFLGELVTIKVDTVKNMFNNGLASKAAGVFLIIIALALASMWVKMIIEGLLTGTAPASLESYTTMVIQALDLGVLVPAAILGGILLLKNEVWGYIIASIFLIKASLIGTAIISMILFMIQRGVEVSSGQMMFFVVLTITGILIAIAFYKQINENGVKIE